MPANRAGLHAGFWRRGAAIFLDSLILALPGLAISHYLHADEAAIAFVIAALMGCAYYGGFHASRWQATPGKHAFGIKVTDRAGARIGLGRAIWRYFATWFSALIFGLGYVLAAVSSNKRALHDLIAGTLVVNAAATPEEIAAGGGTMPVTLGVVLMNVVFLLLPTGGLLAAIAFPSLGPLR
jgi:uncharacterized RDD family membrane protein YckC